MKYDEKLNMSLLFDFYGDILTDRQKEIASLSFDEDLSLREISEITDGVRYKLYTVLCEDGRSVILPGVDEFVKEISEEGGMLVRPIPGFFD